MKVKCWTASHVLWATALGIPMGVLWVVGLPFFALLTLFKNRKRLEVEEVRERY